jgi:hypothetical protein
MKLWGIEGNNNGGIKIFLGACSKAVVELTMCYCFDSNVPNPRYAALGCSCMRAPDFSPRCNGKVNHDEISRCRNGVDSVPDR